MNDRQCSSSSFLLHRSTLGTYKSELLRWTAKVNLIGPEAKEHLDEHIAEAVAAAEILRPRGEVMDFGSGGGLPAIPMAIVSPRGGGPEKVGVFEAHRAGVRLELESVR